MKKQLRIVVNRIVLLSIALMFGCAQGGPAQSESGPAIGGEAKNVFNISFNTNDTSHRGDYNGVRSVPLSNPNSFDVTIYWNGQYVVLPPYSYMYVYMPEGPQTLQIQWPDGRFFYQTI